ncbi:MAG: glycosyltransferase family 4 protein [Halapricum sp.]
MAALGADASEDPWRGSDGMRTLNTVLQVPGTGLTLMPSENLTVGVVGGRDPRELGGVESVVYNIAAYSSDRYEFVQYCAGEEDRVEESDIGTVRTFADRFGPVRTKYLSSLRAAYDLRRREVDLVHGHGDNALGLSVFRPSEPYVVTFHGTIAAMYANVFDDRGVAREVLSRIRPLPELAAARQCDVAVACSTNVKEELVSYYGIDPGKIVVIHNGVDTERFSPVPVEDARRRLALDPDRRYALWVGTDPRRKGLDTARTAVGLAESDVRLLVAGVDGEDSADVRYLGRVPDDRMSALYSAVDALLFPTLYEGFGLVILESISCGTPVVTSPEVPRLETGVYYNEERTTERYARILDDLLAEPPDRAAIREYALEYDWRNVATEYAEVYERAVRG